MDPSEPPPGSLEESVKFPDNYLEVIKDHKTPVSYYGSIRLNPFDVFHKPINIKRRRLIFNKNDKRDSSKPIPCCRRFSLRISSREARSINSLIYMRKDVNDATNLSLHLSLFLSTSTALLSLSFSLHFLLIVCLSSFCQEVTSLFRYADFRPHPGIEYSNEVSEVWNKKMK